MKNLTKIAFSTVAILFVALICSCTSDWPQFRGPGNTMVVKTKNLPHEWAADHNVRWSAPVDGDGWSSPVVIGDRVFLSSAVLVEKITTPQPQEGDTTTVVEDRGDLDDIYRWEVICLDLETGDQLWKKTAREGNPRVRKHRAHNYAGESPVSDGKKLYVYFGMTGLFCYDLEGNLIWEKDLGAFETLRNWGTGSSPVVYRDLLYVQVDNEQSSFLVALDTRDGKEVWKIGRDEGTSYSTPVIWKNRKRAELVTGGKKARSYDPLTGELLWELGMKGHYNIPSAVYDMDHIYLGNAGYRDTPATFFAVNTGAEGDITPAEGDTVSEGVLWSLQDAPLGNPTPLLYDGLLYMVSTRGGNITCLEAATGAVVYQEKVEKVGACWASPWLYEERIFYTDEKGVTRVFRAGREFELLHENRLDDRFWSSMAAGGDAWILKGTEKIYCIGY